MDIEKSFERLQCVRIGDVTVIRLLDRVLSGHLAVIQLGEALEWMLAEDEVPNVALNLARVEIISSTMIGQLIKLNSDVKARGGRLVLTNVSMEVQGIFAMTRIDRLFTIVEDETDALA